MGCHMLPCPTKLQMLSASTDLGVTLVATPISGASQVEHTLLFVDPDLALQQRNVRRCQLDLSGAGTSVGHGDFHALLLRDATRTNMSPPYLNPFPREEAPVMGSMAGPFIFESK